MSAKTTGYTIRFTLEQERHIEAANLHAAASRAKYLISLVPGGRLLTVLRDDIKHEPLVSKCPDCAAEEAMLRAKNARTLKPNWAEKPEEP